MASHDKMLTRIALRDERQVTVRTAQPEDAADILEIRRQVVDENVANVDDHVESHEECRQRLLEPHPETLWLVAETNGKIVGSLRLVKPGPSFLKHIRNLFIEVNRGWRGLGVGQALIMAGAAWAASHGVEMIALSVLDSNPRARSLYERLGFVVTGHTPALVKRPDGTYADDTQMVMRPQPSLESVRAVDGPSTAIFDDPMLPHSTQDGT